LHTISTETPQVGVNVTPGPALPEGATTRYAACWRGVVTHRSGCIPAVRATGEAVRGGKAGGGQHAGTGAVVPGDRGTAWPWVSHGAGACSGAPASGGTGDARAPVVAGAAAPDRRSRRGGRNPGRRPARGERRAGHRGPARDGGRAIGHRAV